MVALCCKRAFALRHGWKYCVSAHAFIVRADQVALALLITVASCSPEPAMRQVTMVMDIRGSPVLGPHRPQQLLQAVARALHRPQQALSQGV